MNLLAITSAKGSPGATSVAHAVAALSGALLVEADPAGGDIAARWGLPLDPGLLTLAAAARRGFTTGLIDHHSQPAHGHPALVAPPSAEQTRSALLSLGSSFADAVAFRPVRPDCLGTIRAIADCGRWDPNGPCVDLVRAARTTVMVMRPSVDAVATVRSRLVSLQPLAQQVIVVTIGDRPYPPAEISDALDGIPTFALSDDPRTAAVLASGRPVERSLRRSTLIRSLQPILHAAATGSTPRHHGLVSR